MSKQSQQVPVKNMMRWTAEEDAKLRQMAEDGMTTAMIAKVLGRTRSAVWGRKSNMGIKTRLSHSEKGTKVPMTVSSRNRTKTPKQKPAKAVYTQLQNATGLEEAAQVAKKYGVKITMIQIG